MKVKNKIFGNILEVYDIVLDPNGNDISYSFSPYGHWFPASAYEEVPSNYDNPCEEIPITVRSPPTFETVDNVNEEDRLRAILTKPSNDCCQKCGAPKSSCNYH